MEKIKIGAVGLGQRGYSLLPLFAALPEMEIAAVCDIYEDRAERGKGFVYEKTGKIPFCTTDYRELIESGTVDAVLILSSWESHVPIAIDCMKHGIPVGCEVGGAYTVEECFELIRVHEETKTPFMFLENCCYGRVELLVLNMVRQGLFGRIVHCEGGYRHDLRSEIAFGLENRHYRLENYLKRNCENYPTHELGPIARVLDIGRGNEFTELYSVSSGAFGLNDYARVNGAVRPELAEARFGQGDIVTTVIKCRNGETVTLTLDTTLPRPYSRGFTVQGTRGMYCEDGNYIYLDRDHTEADHFRWAEKWNNANTYFEKYEHPIWREYLENGLIGGHGGMDGLVYGAFARALLNGEKMPIDVYDAARWMAVTPLSEISLREGRSVRFPEFKKAEEN